MKYFMCIVVSLYYKLLPGVILLIAYLFHPRHTFAVQPFAYGEMRHGGIRGRTVPVLDVGRTQHHVPLPDDLYRTSPFLGQPDAERNEQGLAQRVGVPVGARTRLKGDVGTVDALRGLCLKSRINADIACKILSGCRGRRAGTCRNHELPLCFSMSRGHGHNPGKQQAKDEKGKAFHGILREKFGDRGGR